MESMYEIAIRMTLGKLIRRSQRGSRTHYVSSMASTQSHDEPSSTVNIPLHVSQHFVLFRVVSTASFRLCILSLSVIAHLQKVKVS